MEQFKNQNKLNQFVSFILIMTGVIGLISLAILLWRGVTFDSSLMVYTMAVALSLMGVITGVSMWLKYYWSFSACFIYFLIQIVSYDSEDFSFAFFSGVKFLLITTFNNATMAVNLVAIIMLIIAFIGRNLTIKNNLKIDAEL